MQLSLQQAQATLDGAEASARELGLPMVIAVPKATEDTLKAHQLAAWENKI